MNSTESIDTKSRFLNIAAYKFVRLSDLSQRRRAIKSVCDAAGLRGTILLSREGINMFIAGDEGLIRGLLDSFTSQSEFAGLEIKESWSDDQPFSRMLVRIKKEIISLGVDGIDPSTRPSPKLTAKELRQWIEEQRDITLLDVRNDYEVEVGTFRGATAIGLDHFRNFPDAVSRLPEVMKAKPVVMFCTGGIRCEKAGPYMQQQGFQNIFQLDGGILKYFEECGGQHYEGDCFVFDKRVALRADLKESGLALCFACQAILNAADQASKQYVPPKSCPHCFHSADATLEQRNEAIRAALTPLPGSAPYNNMRPIRIPGNLDGLEMLPCLRQLYPHIGDQHWIKEFEAGQIRLGDRLATQDMIVRAGQRYSHWFPNTVEPDVNANISLLYEDDELLVVNKPAPLPMHPSGRFNRNTLIWMLRHALRLPGVRNVHRLDANTSGVVVLAKSKAIARDLQRQFDRCEVKKSYLAQCAGVPAEKQFTCNVPIATSPTRAGGRELFNEDSNSEAYCHAETRFVRLQSLPDDTALLEVNPVTGRTNQIRLHLWHLGHPVCGDPMYLADRQMAASQTIDIQTAKLHPMRLHSWKFALNHPRSLRRIEFTAPLPDWVDKELLSSAS